MSIANLANCQHVDGQNLFSGTDRPYEFETIDDTRQDLDIKLLAIRESIKSRCTASWPPVGSACTSALLCVEDISTEEVA